MSILSYFQRLFTVQPASVPIAQWDVPSGERVDDGDVLALSAAYACTRLVSGTEASLPARVVQSSGDGAVSVDVKDHWAYRLLHDSPNDEDTPFDFFEEAGASLELRGNALARKELSNDRTVALTPMPCDLTRVYRNSDGELRYEFDGDKLTPAEVLHVRGFGRDRARLGGLSTIMVGAATFGLNKAVNRSAGAVFKNGIRSQIALTSERDLDEKQMTDARAIVEEKYGGSMNTGRPLILNNGWKATTLSINPEDAQLLQSRAFGVEDVCRFFGVPPFMIGHSEKTTSWGSGVEQAVLGFQKFAMAPRLKRMEQALTKQLLMAEDLARGLKVEFNLEALLRGDSGGRSAFYRTMSQIGAMTINEIRAKENLRPVPGGDVPRLQAQNVPITEAGNEVPAS